MRRLNVKLVVLLSTISVVAVVLVAVVHEWQMKRTARVLLVRAKEAQSQAEESDDDKDLETAASLYQQYVAYRPEDAEEGAQMALLMADLAEKPGASKNKLRAAYAALEEQLRRHPERDDVRTRLVDFTMAMGRWGDAIDHIKELLTKTPDDVDLLTKLGTCNFYLDNNRDAEQTLREAISKDPLQVAAYGMLASILRERLNSPDQADETIDKMVEMNPEDAKARLSRAVYIANYFKPEEGRDVTARIAQRKDDVKKALELTPEDANTLFYAATTALEDEKVEEARRLLEHAQKVDPENERVVQYLIALDVRDQDFDAVKNRLKDGPKTGELQQIDFEIKLMNRDIAGAKKVLADLEEDPDASRPMMEFMRASLNFHELKWLQASKELEQLRPVLPASYQVRIDLMLGHCYEQLREPDRELQAFERAAADSRGGISAHAGLAMALMKLGKTDRARAELETVKRAQGLDQFVQSDQARSALLTLLLQRNAALPESERDWKEIDEIVDATAKAFPGSKELLLVESSIREHKGDRAAARQMLREAIEKDSTDPVAWLSLARLEFLDSGPAAAIKLLDEAQEKVGDAFAMRQSRVVYAMQLPAAQAKEVLEVMSQGLEKFSPEEQDRLRRVIGIGYFRTDDLAKARAMWTKIAEQKPNDPDAQFTLFDIAVRDGDDKAISESVNRIKRLFGAGSPEAKFVEARSLVSRVRAKKSEDSEAALSEARQLVNRAAEQRPRWGILARFEGEIDMLEGRPDDAITHLQRAIEYGDTDVGTARQIAQLLVSRGRGEEARGYMQLANARNVTGDSAASDMLEVSIAISESDIPKAVKLLESAREREPDDAQKIAILGQLLPQLGRDDEAEQLLRELAAKQPELPLAWFELVRYLKMHRREDDARQVISEAAAKLPKEEVDLAVGQCYELIGDMDAAEKSFVQARDAAPDDLGMTRALATFYVRTKQQDKAQQELTRLVKSKTAKDSDKEHVAWANRELAIIIASSGNYSDFQRAMAQLGPKDGRARVPLADKEAMARLLANRPEADSRMEATRILEEIKSETPLRSDAQLILARLYEVTGNWPQCRDEMLSLVGKNKDNASYVATFVEMLMRNNDQDAATFWMARLEEIAPEALTTGALRARLLVKQGKPEEAVAVLRNLLPRPMPREKLGMLVQVAKLLEELEQFDAAESMYREFVAIDPPSILVLAGYMGRHGTLKDALDLCQRALEMPNMAAEQVIRQALGSLRVSQGEATKEDYGRVEGWVTKAIARNHKQLILQLEYAELLDLEGRYPELEEFYEKLLKTAEMNEVQRALVLNNLAYLLAVQNRAGDSRKYIDEAVQILGPQSDLLDTRALVHLAHGEMKQAVDDLNLSVVDQPTGTKYFHLARAYQMSSNPQPAQDAFKKAIDNYALKVDDLPRLEQGAFRQLSEQLGLN